LKHPSPKNTDLFLDRLMNEEFTYNLVSPSQFENSSDGTSYDIGTEVNTAKTNLEKEFL
jgi:hypothetical protein